VLTIVARVHGENLALKGGAVLLESFPHLRKWMPLMALVD